MRLFVAADVPEDLRESIESQIVHPLRDRLPGARFTRPEGRHLTLKFLGEVADERVGEFASVVSAAVEVHAAFQASFSDIGGFPNLRRPRVLWVGIGEGADAFTSLAGDLDTALEPFGLLSENRPFRSHLTLARFNEARTVDVPAISVPTARFLVPELVLFRSHLHPTGATYERLQRFALTA